MAARPLAGSMRLTDLRRRAILLASALPLLPRDPGPDGADPGPVVTVLAANLCRTLVDAEAQAQAVLATDADIVLLTEVAATTVAALEAAGLARQWPHVSDDRDEGYFGSLVASRHPIAAKGTGNLGGRRGQVIDLDVDGTALRVVPVHTQAPIFDDDVAVWEATIAANASLADGAPGPAILAGDWNATGGHRAYRRALADHGLVDAQARRGRRWWPTWPVDLPVFGLPLPAVLTLDHVVVTADVAILGLERITVPGTDHRALRAALRLPTGGDAAPDPSCGTAPRPTTAASTA